MTGQELKELREELGISVPDLSEMMGWSKYGYHHRTRNVGFTKIKYEEVLQLDAIARKVGKGFLPVDPEKEALKGKIKELAETIQ